MMSCREILSVVAADLGQAAGLHNTVMPLWPVMGMRLKICATREM